MRRAIRELLEFASFFVVLILLGCVQTRIAAYYNPKPGEPCKVHIIVDGVEKACVSPDHASEILKEMVP